MSNRLDSLDDVKLWIARHDGRIDAWWEAQHQWNKDKTKLINDLNIRIGQLERRIIWVAGLMSGIGTMIGTTVSHALMK